MYDIERVTKEFSDTLEKAGCKLDVPVTINGRLTSTLGRVIYRGNNPYKVEFSKQFLGTSTDDCIYQVILHEAAHFIAAKRSGVCHHHDGYFKQICAEIGCTNDQTKTHVERTVALEKIYKYVVYCQVISVGAKLMIILTSVLANLAAVLNFIIRKEKKHDS